MKFILKIAAWLTLSPGFSQSHWHIISTWIAFWPWYIIFTSRKSIFRLWCGMCVLRSGLLPPSDQRWHWLMGHVLYGLFIDGNIFFILNGIANFLHATMGRISCSCAQNFHRILWCHRGYKYIKSLTHIGILITIFAVLGVGFTNGGLAVWTLNEMLPFELPAILGNLAMPHLIAIIAIYK